MLDYPLGSLDRYYSQSTKFCRPPYPANLPCDFLETHRFQNGSGPLAFIHTPFLSSFVPSTAALTIAAAPLSGVSVPRNPLNAVAQKPGHTDATAMSSARNTFAW